MQFFESGVCVCGATPCSVSPLCLLCLDCLIPCTCPQPLLSRYCLMSYTCVSPPVYCVSLSLVSCWIVVYSCCLCSVFPVHGYSWPACLTLPAWPRFPACPLLDVLLFLNFCLIKESFCYSHLSPVRFSAPEPHPVTRTWRVAYLISSARCSGCAFWKCFRACITAEVHST